MQEDAKLMKFLPEITAVSLPITAMAVSNKASRIIDGEIGLIMFSDRLQHVIPEY